MARFTSWWKASVYEWDAMLAAMRRTTAQPLPKELAAMDVDFLTHQGRTMSVSDLADRWQWSRDGTESGWERDRKDTHARVQGIF